MTEQKTPIEEYPSIAKPVSNQIDIIRALNLQLSRFNEIANNISDIKLATSMYKEIIILHEAIDNLNKEITETLKEHNKTIKTISNWLSSIEL